MQRLLHWINALYEKEGGDTFLLYKYIGKDVQHMFYIISWWLISNYSQTKPPMIDVLTDSLFARRSLLTSFSYFIYGERMVSRQYIFSSICLLQWVDYISKYCHWTFIHHEIPHNNGYKVFKEDAFVLLFCFVFYYIPHLVNEMAYTYVLCA